MSLQLFQRTPALSALLIGAFAGGGALAAATLFGSSVPVLLGAVTAVGALLGFFAATLSVRPTVVPEIDPSLATERRYRLLTENLAAAVLIRAATGRIEYCSPYTEVLTGYSLSEIYRNGGDFFEQLVNAEDRERYHRSMQVSLMGEPFQFRYRLIHRTGIEIWVESRTVPVLNEGGEVTSSLTIALDVTGAVRYQRQVEERNRDLQDFTYMVSHDLKGPIFTIKGMLGIVADDNQDGVPAAIQEPLEHIGRAASRLEQLVLGVLEYSRATSTEIRTLAVPVAPVVTQVLEDLELAIAKAGAVVDVCSPLPSILGDPLPLSQIVTNLLSNALKYRSPERSLQIRIATLSDSPTGLLRLSIADNGQGIPPDKLTTIFRPFQRLHGKEIEGSGIGLACVQKLTERLGGEIEAHSDGVSGTEFILSLRPAPVTGSP